MIKWDTESARPFGTTFFERRESSAPSSCSHGPVARLPLQLDVSRIETAHRAVGTEEG
jgi:hypothetical protein